METGSIVTEEFQFLDPISDFGFKKIFGNERSKEVLIRFLNELLKSKKKILKISFMMDVQPEYTSDRSILIDMHCVGDDGQNFIIEMQRVNHINFRSMKKIPKALNQGVFKKVFEIADLNKLTPDERMVYDLKMFHKENLKNADLFQFQEGKEEGKIEGIEEGIEIGVKKTAREMKLEGIPLPTIAKITKLSSTEIEDL